MSIPQAAEESVKYTEFLTELVQRFDEISWGPAYSDGTRVFAKRGGFWRAFLISDLTAPERIVGSITVTIPANAVLGTATGAIALKDPVTSYKVFTTVNDPGSNFWSAKARLSSKTLLQVQAFRPVNSVTASATGVTVGAGDLTDIDVLIGGQNPHGADAGLFGHAHTTTGHPVTDPSHTHNVQSSVGQAVVNVDYLIWHV